MFVSVVPARSIYSSAFPPDANPKSVHLPASFSRSSSFGWAAERWISLNQASAKSASKSPWSSSSEIVIAPSCTHLAI